MSNPLPSHIGRYQVLKELGRGAFGAVYLAFDPDIQREVAIKLLHQTALQGADPQLLLAEARAQGKVQHPHVVQIYDVQKLDSGDFFIVSQYLPGGTLADKLTGTPWSIEDAVAVAVQLADALEAAHRQGLVHRDFKPGNILLDEHGQAYVGDFGLALHETDQHKHRDELSGTPAYMAPEQTQGQSHHLDGRTDIWALGVILYEMLTGVRPFVGQNVLAMFEEIEKREPKPLRVRNPHVPKELESIVLKCLQKPITQRYATAADLCEDLRSFQVAETMPSGPPFPVPAEGKAPAHSGRKVAFAAILGVLMALGIFAATRPSTPSESPEDNTKSQDIPTAKTEDPGEQIAQAEGIPEKTTPKQSPPTPPEKVPVPETDPKTLAVRAEAILRKHCLACHGDEFRYPGLDLRDRVTLLRPNDPKEEPFIVPGKPKDSRLWQMLDSEAMPPDGQPQLSEDEKSTIQHWIAAGAEFPANPRPAREFVGEKTLLHIIAEDLENQPESKRRYLRYFSIAHLWNNPQVSEEQLRLTRAAISKLLNSLSSQPRIVPPTSVDKDGLVLRFHLNDYGWQNGRQWQALQKAYPYGLQQNDVESLTAYRLSQSELPYLRGDWFVYHASRAPLYDELVTLPEFYGLPDQQRDLERLLGVETQINFEKDRMWRAGFTGEKSGVSKHNRVVDRHDAKYGYYWPSFDFQGEADRQNVHRFPLGPSFEQGNNLGAFEHAGGEIIFSLPNGLQAYLLVKADGSRIPQGPLEIVSDPQQFSGNYTIVNGISCMGCHKHGLLHFEDTVRAGFLGKTGSVADKVLRIYPAQKTMNKLIEQDRRGFLAALEEAIGTFLVTNKDQPITAFPEPITAVSKRYDRRLSITEVASELGLPQEPATAQTHGIKASAGELANVIKLSDKLRRLELAPLAAGETISRKQWEAAYQRTARELGLGIPFDIE